MEKNYWLIHMGEHNKFADVALKDKIIAIGWNDLDIDLSKFYSLPSNDFYVQINEKLSKVYIDRTVNAIGAITGHFYRFCVQMKIGDIVLMPKTDQGKLYVGKIESDYIYIQNPTGDCPYRHRRAVNWISEIQLKDISVKLKNSIGSIMTMFSISNHAQEIENLISGNINYVSRENKEIEDLSDFGLESHLEDFLVYNWAKLDLGKKYNIYTEDNQIMGQQYIVDVGRIDILAKSKDDKEWLVIELKKGRSSDSVVGQLLRYMGFIKKHKAKEGDVVKGMIITGEEDKNIIYAISNLPNVSFRTYTVQFKLQEKKL